MKVVQFDSLNQVYQRFISEAVSARLHARADYSHFHVGAAVGVSDSERHIIASGCNVENAILEVTHAEQAAIARLVMMLMPCEMRCVGIVAIAMEALTEDQHALPCGLCRQWLREFGDDSTVILGAKLNKVGVIWQVEVTTLDELLPYSFGQNNLGK